MTTPIVFPGLDLSEYVKREEAKEMLRVAIAEVEAVAAEGMRQVGDAAYRAGLRDGLTAARRVEEAIEAMEKAGR
jgi:predicted metal-dependent hydrolase